MGRAGSSASEPGPGRMAAALSIRAARSAPMTSSSSSDMCTPADQLLTSTLPSCSHIMHLLSMLKLLSGAKSGGPQSRWPVRELPGEPADSASQPKHVGLLAHQQQDKAALLSTLHLSLSS